MCRVRLIINSFMIKFLFFFCTLPDKPVLAQRVLHFVQFLNMRCATRGGKKKVHRTLILSIGILTFDILMFVVGIVAVLRLFWFVLCVLYRLLTMVLNTGR